MVRRKFGDEKGTAQDPKHTSSSVKHGGGGVMAWACMAATGTGTPIFNDDGTANSEDRKHLICSSLSKCLQTHWTVLHPVTK